MSAPFLVVSPTVPEWSTPSPLSHMSSDEPATFVDLAPHLHYEVWSRDRARNPMHYIMAAYRSFD